MEPGTQLTHYVVEEKIGEGGMGEVWLGRDTRLDRQVAIKILPPAFVDDEERLTRFEREAKALATLNHPHIAQIFGVDQVDHVCFLVLELVQGETLADRIEGGALPVEEALNLCRQIAEGLEAAHDAGIVHRDLKPSNVRITPEGVVKILDFGLAKSSSKDPETGSTMPLESDSLTLTAEGKVLGTPTYMSPEQARGKRTDRRTDIWAFGCVLFETLTGQRAFSGETVTDVLGAIVHKEPEWELLPPRTPTRVRELLRRCLSKDQKSRLRDIGDARVELEEILADPTATMAIDALPEARPVRKGRLALLLLLVAVIAAGATYAALQSMRTEPPVRRFRLSVEEIELGGTARFSISPDGTRVLYSAAGQLWIRDLDKLTPRALADTEGATHGFWSPDGRDVGFATANKLWRVPADGGRRAAITALPDEISNVGAATWQEDGTIVWGTAISGDPLLRVSAGGGDPRVLLEPSEERGEADFHDVVALPDDKGLLFSLHRTGEGSADTLSVLPAGATELRRLITPEGGDDLSTPCYAPSGHILYRRSGSNPGIWALPFSLDELVATGEAFLVAPNGYRPSVSNDGTLLHSESAVNANFQLVLADRQGRTDQPIGEPLEGQAFLPGMSADGRRATLSTTSDEATNVWAFDLASGARTRLLLQQKGFAVAPLWMPSGTHVIGARGNFPDVEFFRLATDGSGTVEVLGEGLFPLDVTPDGSTLLMGRPGGQASYFILSLDETGEPTPFLDGPGDKEGASLSPDGRYVAYSSDESGHSEVYVTRFPSGEGKWLVYEKEAADPIWSPAGDEIFFMSDGDFRAAPVSTEGGVSIGPSEVLFALSGTGLELARGYEITSTGQNILALRSTDIGGDDSGMVLVENWAVEFADR